MNKLWLAILFNVVTWIGTFPSTISGLTAVVHMDLGGNKLQGDRCYLVKFYKHEFWLCLGVIPSTISALTGLTFLNFQYNNFYGTWLVCNFRVLNL